MNRDHVIPVAPVSLSQQLQVRWPVVTWVDRIIQLIAGFAVAALAVIAGMVSFTHMRVLAAGHGEGGWQAFTFPMSVDGVEIVASLVLLSDRRMGRRSSVLVWVSLAVGTGASMAANVAVAIPDLIGRVISGWPAVALLIAIKLLSGLISHPTPATPAPGRQRRRVPVADRPAASASITVRPPHRGGPERPAARTNVADLVPVVRDICTAITADGVKPTRVVVRQRLREQGVSVSNDRLSLVLQALTEQPDSAAGSGPVRVTTAHHR